MIKIKNIFKHLKLITKHKWIVLNYVAKQEYHGEEFVMIYQNILQQNF